MNKEKIELLDCTLRDGGHVVNSYFGKETITGVINNLSNSNIEIIECGLLQNCEFDIAVAKYNTIAEIKSVIKYKKPGTKYSLLAQVDLYDINNLEYNDGFIDIIRISFHDIYIKEGLEYCRKIKELGYDCCVNPINLPGYSDEQIIELINMVNKINPYAFSIVDTFGILGRKDLRRIYYLLDNNLNQNIKVAVHLHENQGLSFSLAQDLIEINIGTRGLCIDGSLLGMGREPGNLCIELIANYLNNLGAKKYELYPIYDAIDEYIKPIKDKHKWEYSIEYALSAQCKVHRTYAEYLFSKGKLKTKQINDLLSSIDRNKATRYDKQYIENLYIDYQSIYVSNDDIDKLRSELRGKVIVAVAPGNSILKWQDKINEIINKESAIVIYVNFDWKAFEANYCLFSNEMRYSQFEEDLMSKKIITSNISRDYSNYDYCLNYKDYAFYDNNFADNGLCVVLNLIWNVEAKKVYLAGFDGYENDGNYALSSMDNRKTDNSINEESSDIIAFFSRYINMEMITPSKYM